MLQVPDGNHRLQHQPRLITRHMELDTQQTFGDLFHQDFAKQSSKLDIFKRLDEAEGPFSVCQSCLRCRLHCTDDTGASEQFRTSVDSGTGDRKNNRVRGGKNRRPHWENLFFRNQRPTQQASSSNLVANPLQTEPAHHDFAKQSSKLDIFKRLDEAEGPFSVWQSCPR